MQASTPEMKASTLEFRDADVLIIVPPFSKLVYPSLGAHILQALGRAQGVEVHVWYANIQLAAEIGVEEYDAIYDGSALAVLLGERFFARAAFGLPALGRNQRESLSLVRDFGRDRAAKVDLEYDARSELDFDRVHSLETRVSRWLDQITTAVVARRYRVVGCTSMFQQVAASVALLTRIKAKRPETITIVGGPNCEGEMADGFASLKPGIDYVFSGESEETFSRFLAALGRNELPSEKIIRGSPCLQMDRIPSVTYEDYFVQLESALGGEIAAQDTWLLYETSRGCWWGQKHHCTFCGLNGEGISFRQKSAGRVLAELETLAERAPTRNVMATDNILPNEYFKTLLPKLAQRPLGLNLFYEVKANLSLERMLLLRDAGIHCLQPGIEALSSSLLTRMRKGVSARQNLMLLRYGRAAGMNITWNLLWAFPGDEVEDYEQTLRMVRYMHHLQPPNAFGHLSIERFSPYFMEPALHQVENIRPLRSYADFLPREVDAEKFAYHFVADYPSAAYERNDLVKAIDADIRAWRARWDEKRHPPELAVVVREGQHALIDTRGLGATEQVRLLERDEATLLLIARPYAGTEEEERALEQSLALVVDGWFVPLAVAAPELMLELAGETRDACDANRFERGIPPTDSLRASTPEARAGIDGA